MLEAGVGIPSYSPGSGHPRGHRSAPSTSEQEMMLESTDERTASTDLAKVLGTPKLVTGKTQESLSGRYQFDVFIVNAELFSVVLLGVIVAVVSRAGLMWSEWVHRVQDSELRRGLWGVIPSPGPMLVDEGGGAVEGGVVPQDPGLTLEACWASYKAKYHPKVGPEELTETMRRLACRPSCWKEEARVPLYGMERLKRACLIGTRSFCRPSRAVEPDLKVVECCNLELGSQPRVLKESELFTPVSATLNLELLH